MHCFYAKDEEMFLPLGAIKYVFIFNVQQERSCIEYLSCWAKLLPPCLRLWQFKKMYCLFLLWGQENSWMCNVKQMLNGLNIMNIMGIYWHDAL